MAFESGMIAHQDREYWLFWLAFILFTLLGCRRLSKSEERILDQN